MGQKLSYKKVGCLERGMIVAKVNEAMQGIVSAGERKGNHQSIR